MAGNRFENAAATSNITNRRVPYTMPVPEVVPQVTKEQEPEEARVEAAPVTSLPQMFEIAEEKAKETPAKKEKAKSDPIKVNYSSAEQRIIEKIQMENPEKNRRTQYTVYVKKRNIERLEEIAKYSNTSVSRLVDTMFDSFLSSEK